MVGDVKADDVELAIRTAFDGVPKATSPNPVPPCLKAQSRHFPPIVHEWSGGKYDQTSSVPLDGERILEMTDDQKNERARGVLRCCGAFHLTMPGVVSFSVLTAMRRAGTCCR